ncbi:hypothetical protein EVAR_59239_1 [Eumeta japonica]|uniref:Uncharacterized protein n=1 Tax=Eumeta variegata TaxID=151549 RepID=A0A4C1ZI34_EUMVA|nr:hypothetical protein EVAR_59239_1 [Eumeta japonica]
MIIARVLKGGVGNVMERVRRGRSANMEAGGLPLVSTFALLTIVAVYKLKGVELIFIERPAGDAGERRPHRCPGPAGRRRTLLVRCHATVDEYACAPISKLSIAD